MRGQVALQLYTVRRELQENPERALNRVKEIGFEWVEVAPMQEGLSAPRLAELLQERELKVAGIHCDLPITACEFTAAALVNEFDCARLIWHGWPRDPAHDTVEGWARLAERYNDAASNALRRGWQLGLHNHWWEFERVQGRQALPFILERLSPEVFLELDTYWARTAGADPAAAMREFESRISMLHLKDGPARQGEPMCALGDGVMDFASIFHAANARVEWLVIELDECQSDIWEAVRRSFEFLKPNAGPVCLEQCN